MSELSRFYGIIIAIYFRDVGKHNAPHIHVDYAGHSASVEIETGDVLDGKLPPPVLRLVQQWMDEHQEELFDRWDRAVAGQKVPRIAPLKRHRRLRRRDGR